MVIRVQESEILLYNNNIVSLSPGKSTAYKRLYGEALTKRVPFPGYMSMYMKG